MSILTTEIDRQSAEWLAGGVLALGLRPALEPFALSRIEPLPSLAESDGRHWA